MSDLLKVITKVDFYGKTLNVYGRNKKEAYENSLFLAKEVAECIEYNQRTNGQYDTSGMLLLVDKDEKLKIFGSLGSAPNSRKPAISMGPANRWFLTEEGLGKCYKSTSKSIYR